MAALAAAAPLVVLAAGAVVLAAGVVAAELVGVVRVLAVLPAAATATRATNGCVDSAAAPLAAVGVVVLAWWEAVVSRGPVPLSVGPARLAAPVVAPTCRVSGGVFVDGRAVLVATRAVGARKSDAVVAVAVVAVVVVVVVVVGAAVGVAGGVGAAAVAVVAVVGWQLASISSSPPLQSSQSSHSHDDSMHL